MATKTWSVHHRGKSFTFELNKLKVSADHRTELARVLKEALTDAGYAAKQVDRELANHVIGLIGSGAEISNEAITELGEIYDGVAQVMSSEATEEQTVATKDGNKDLELMREIAAIAGSAEGREALNLARVDKSRLTPAQREIVDKHDMLLKQHNEIADAERAGKGGGVMQPLRHYVPASILALKNLPPAEIANRTGEMIRAMRKDPRYLNANDVDHKQAVYEMNLLYKGQYFEGENEQVLPPDEK